jgi:hypothetical protein
VTRLVFLALLVVVAILALIESLRLSGPPGVLPARPSDPPPVVAGPSPWPHDGGPLETIDTRTIDPAAALRIGARQR